jgi:nucleotide-binding universal stress UspA family protein
MTDEQKRIVLGFNPYFTADEVTRVAIEHGVAFGARLEVVASVVGHQLSLEGKLADIPAQSRLDRTIAAMEESGVEHDVHLVVREKTPGRDLVTFAEKVGAYELVIGFKQRSAIGEALFGSNYRQMIAEAPCPVVTVHVST